MDSWGNGIKLKHVPSRVAPKPPIEDSKSKQTKKPKLERKPSNSKVTPKDINIPINKSENAPVDPDPK